MEPSVTIRRIPVGMLEANCYLLCCGGECCLIDPGDEAERLLRAAEESGCALRFLLLTHGHFDHYGAVRPILARFPALPVYLHEGDLSDGEEQLRMRRIAGADLRPLHEGDELRLGGLTLRVLETPGHSAGSCVFQAGELLFTGDTLFAGSCGRADFPGSDPRAMRDSLRRLASLTGDYRVLPGHGDATTLERERRTNYYLR